MWNLESEINKQNRKRLRDRESRLMVTRGEGSGGLGETGAEIEKYSVLVTK